MGIRPVLAQLERNPCGVGGGLPAAAYTENMANSANVAGLRKLLQGELEGVALYRALAGIESRPELKEVYGRMAESEERHAARWRKQLVEAGDRRADPGIGWRTRMMIALAKRFGADFILPTIAEREKIDSAGYAAGAPGIAAAPALAGDERSHAMLLGVIAAKGAGGMEGGALAQLEGRHRAAGGNALRAAVLGANDGLVSNLSLVMGVAGAELAGSSILVTGLAGLLAGAGSMALGEWLSVQSARELFQHQIEIEQAELAADPEEERRELELIYRAKGLDPQAAQQIAAQLIADPARAVNTLAMEELGVDPKELGGSAWVAAITSFILFAIGAVIPVIPYGLLAGQAALWTSVVASAFGLFGIGALITLMTGRSVWFSGLRQLLFGLVAAALTYGVGHLIGVSLAG